MKKHKMFSELGDFLILWGSQAISTLGTAMTNYALSVWVYGQKGTASSITLLSACSFLPSILFCFVAGTVADRWDKKSIMLSVDFAAALGTTTLLILHQTSRLQIWHLYLVNFLLSFMNAFQWPAAYVATSLLVPKEHYVRASGLQALSGSVITILAPALSSALLAFAGLKMVLLVDLFAFAFGFSVLLFLVKIPAVKPAQEKSDEPFLKSCAAGVNFLRAHLALLRLILFFAFINLIAKMGGYGMLPAFILGRTGNNQVMLGMVEAAVGAGVLVGGILVTMMKPAKNRVKVVFFACGISFLIGDVGHSLTHTLPFWIIAAFASNVPLAFLNANLTAIMRTNVPIEMQGRVISARDTIQYSTIPVGLLMGGFLADHVLEPFMAKGSVFQSILAKVFGYGKGSGVALLFFIVGVVGFAVSFLSLKNPVYRVLDSPVECYRSDEGV